MTVDRDATTVEAVHVFENHVAGNSCLATAVFKPGSRGVEHRLCVTNGEWVMNTNYVVKLFSKKIFIVNCVMKKKSK